jgi:hypothetical protein
MKWRPPGITMQRLFFNRHRRPSPRRCGTLYMLGMALLFGVAILLIKLKEEGRRYADN